MFMDIGIWKSNTDKEKLKKIFQKNKELMERLERQFSERKVLGQRIV